MNRTSLALLLWSATAAIACKSTSPNTDSVPIRDDWKVEYEGSFRLVDGDGNPFITSLTIGSREGFNDNFVNRGDVIVEFNGAPNTIKIELRRFTFAADEQEAQEEFDQMELWAYSLGGTPKPPVQLDDADRCNVETGWKDNCSILLYYGGQTQLQRTGADIRVTLPPDYRQRLSIETSDSLAESTYPNNGNVCVSNLNATANIKLWSGLAFVTMASDITPSPECSESDGGSLLQDCVSTEWPDTCGCIAQGFDFGEVSVSSDRAAEVTVDAPAALWTSFALDNTSSTSDRKACPAALDGMSNVEYTLNDAAQPWKVIGETNHPAMATPGVGFKVALESGDCTEVASVESPDDWVEGAMPIELPAELHGRTTLCAGCLAGKSCAELLPGG